MRVYNFNGGPATLPQEVLEQAAAEFLDWQGTGMSVLENSHRAKEIVKLFEDVSACFKRLLSLDDDWQVLFIQGGATMQFGMLPLNFAADGGPCDYVNTGLWGTKAFKEAKQCGAKARLAASGEDNDFTRIPQTFDFDRQARYIHLTSNNTVRGTQWAAFPKGVPAPLAADMSSDFLSRPLDLSEFGLVYAGAQKNIGPAGLAVVLIRKSFAEKAAPPKTLPTIMNYRVYMESDSMNNTPPVFAVYMAGLVASWVENKIGGLEKMARINQGKAKALYDAIDQSGGFYKGTADPGSRSLMNVTFKLPTEELENAFKSQAAKNNLVGLGGHRSVGGLRASIYNAMPMEGVKALIDFMAEFKRVNG